MEFLLLYRNMGTHVHVRVFQAKSANTTWEKNGHLVFDHIGWVTFKEKIAHTGFQVRPEDVGAVYDAAESDSGL